MLGMSVFALAPYTVHKAEKVTCGDTTATSE